MSKKRMGGRAAGMARTISISVGPSPMPLPPLEVPPLPFVSKLVGPSIKPVRESRRCVHEPDQRVQPEKPNADRLIV
eukprot:scaffold14091_cov121-Isochrysis_galbana.AAC.21